MAANCVGKLALAGMMVALLSTPLRAQAAAESIDGEVVQFRLPPGDVTLFYNESRGGFTVELRTETASVQGRRLFIGDGKVALEMRADPTHGIFLQGKPFAQGFVFKRQQSFKVLPGYKRAHELKHGDVYVTLPSVLFDWPGQ